MNIGALMLILKDFPQECNIDVTYKYNQLALGNYVIRVFVVDKLNLILEPSSTESAAALNS
jgi:hypothetical protein